MAQLLDLGVYIAQLNSQLCYVLLGILGTAGVLVLSRGARSNSNISMLAGPTPSSAVWGSTPDMFDAERDLEFQAELMNTYGSACRVKGSFGADELWISGPRALQEIPIKGHDDLREPAWLITWLRLVFGPVVPTIYGHQHEIDRKVWSPDRCGRMVLKPLEILNPVFTASHVRNCNGNELSKHASFTISNSPWTQTPAMTTIAQRKSNSTEETLR
ncbi:hypothetical protein RSAG8_03414, partial [Rhizoctonia solani AG-8 WAC10335]